MKQATSLESIFTGRERKRQQGTVAVEMAIVLPLFGLLLLGILEIGSMARDYQVLQNAAREGARFSALPANRMSGSSSPSAVRTTIQNRVIAYLQNERINSVAAGDITVNQAYPLHVGALTVEGSQIVISYNRSLLFPGVANLIALPTIPLRGNAVF